MSGVANAAPAGANHDLQHKFHKLRVCESGNDYHENTGNGYFGAYQFSRSTWHGLGFHGRLADNIANYPVGTTLGMIFRFWTYRTWIFPKIHAEPADVRPEVASSSAIVR